MARFSPAQQAATTQVRAGNPACSSLIALADRDYTAVAAALIRIHEFHPGKHVRTAIVGNELSRAKSLTPWLLCCMLSRFIVGEGISRPKVPCGGALLCKPGLGLKLRRTILDAFISPALSLHQIFGGSSLKQAGSLKTNLACVRMSS